MFTENCRLHDAGHKLMIVFYIAQYLPDPLDWRAPTIMSTLTCSIEEVGDALCQILRRSNSTMVTHGFDSPSALPT